MPEKSNINNVNKLGDLPEWNLADLYENSDSSQINKDLKAIEELAKDFQVKYEAKISKLNPKELFYAIQEFESLSSKMHKIVSYAHLLFVENIKNIKNKVFFQKIKEKITELNSLIIFFELEINSIDEQSIKKLINDSNFSQYSNWIKIARQFKPHQLNKELEKLMNDKNITSASAWSRLFDETIATLKFNFEGKDYSSTEIFNYTSDTDQKKREGSSKSIGNTLKEHINIFTIITNNLAKDKSINDNWRNFSNSVSNRNLINVVEDEVVEALSKSVQDSYPNLSHRYYALKSKWFNKESLMYWDRNAPLPFEYQNIFSWDEAKQIVLSAYGLFSNEMHSIAKMFFDKSWIDAPVRDGKQFGAFSASTVPDIHPYILLNYQGKMRDVSTLAHELGHGIHQYLASKQGFFNSSTPLTLAETASVFGEMLTFKYMLSKEKNTNNKKVLLANKVEDMLNTVVRQIAFFEFEKKIHDNRKKGELTTDQICDIWMKVQSKSLGPSIVLSGNYKYFWSYIPHFIHSPFYVYAYAFGDCLVNSLYSVYEKSRIGFEEKYIYLLKSGGSRNYKELLKNFDLNPYDKRFWQKGLNVISNLIDELENLEDN
tara:strand:+ start:1178 stop:2980 length:1803 start_codon:yes stop_codon:yes gene_type:complete